MMPPPSLFLSLYFANDVFGRDRTSLSLHTHRDNANSRLPSDEYPPPHGSQWYEEYVKASPLAGKEEKRGLPPLRPHHVVSDLRTDEGRPDSGGEDALPAVVPSENTG
jgi:hypothetical protein